MKQLPTRRQMYWITALAAVMTVLSGGGSLAFTVGYFIGQAVFLSLLLIVLKVLKDGFNRLRSTGEQAESP